MTVANALAAEAEEFRAELVGFCYRYFGSYAEAEDAVQETMVRAWQRADRFEQRAALRTWLYKIATNICLDMKRAPQRRSLPMDLSAPGDVPADPTSLVTRPEQTWIGPISDSHLPMPADPAEAAELRESIRLAFVTALQVLPPRQRVILILRDVLAWSALECADLLELSVAVYHDVGDGRWEPFAIHVLDTDAGRISAITHFMGPQAFVEFGLPPEVGPSPEVTTSTT